MQVSVTPLVFWWVGILAGPWQDPSGDVLIVLDRLLLEKGIMGDSSYWRSTYAVVAWREGRFDRVGPQRRGVGRQRCRRVDARLSRGSGCAPRSDPDRDAGRTTRENTICARAAAGGPGRNVLLTSDYRMFRAHRALRKAGLEVCRDQLHMRGNVPIDRSLAPLS